MCIWEGYIMYFDIHIYYTCLFPLLVKCSHFNTSFISLCKPIRGYGIFVRPMNIYSMIVYNCYVIYGFTSLWLQCSHGNHDCEPLDLIPA